MGVRIEYSGTLKSFIKGRGQEIRIAPDRINHMCSTYVYGQLKVKEVCDQGH